MSKKWPNFAIFMANDIRGSVQATVSLGVTNQNLKRIERFRFFLAKNQFFIFNSISNGGLCRRKPLDNESECVRLICQKAKK